MVGRAGPRRADDHRDGRPHAAGLRDRRGGGDAHGASSTRPAPRRPPQRLRQDADRPAADAQRARRPVRSSPRRPPRWRCAWRAPTTRPTPTPTPATTRPTPSCSSASRPPWASTGPASARPNHAVRGAGVPRRRRLRRGVGHAAPLPRGAAGLDLGGLGQRHEPRRPARAGRSPRALEVFLAEVEPGRRAPTPRLDARVRELQRRVRRPRDARGPRAAGRRAMALCAAGLAARAPRAARPSPTPSAPSRLGGDGGLEYGTLPAGHRLRGDHRLAPACSAGADERPGAARTGAYH